MQFLKITMVLFAFFTLGTFTSCGNAENKSDKTETVDKSGPEYTSAYICPMHCAGSGSDSPGTCPVCNMDYVANKENNHDGHDHGDHDGHNH